LPVPEPTQSNITSSPISIFVACAPETHADVKIAMLRLFSDCIDIGDSNDDGWTVHEWLKRAYSKERVPISQNSITWLFYLTAKEEYVEFGARTVWCALQHAMRSVFTHASDSNFFGSILALSDAETAAISPTHAAALGLWLALLVSGRELIPMALNAGSALQMRGFDWEEDDIPHAQFVKALPEVYGAWCNALIRTVEKLGEYMQLELEHCVRELGWERHILLHAVSHAQTTGDGSSGIRSHSSVCSGCGDDYGTLGSGLVEPAHIARAECIGTNHKFKCACEKPYTYDTDISYAELPAYTGSYYCSDSEYDSDDEYDSGFFDAEEEFLDAESYSPTQEHFSTQATGLFPAIALQLYRSHGRVWMGEYEPGEHLCATCFLRREQYLSDDGLGADFPPMPESFEGLRVAR
jgi:hypothetical protein